MAVSLSNLFFLPVYAGEYSRYVIGKIIIVRQNVFDLENPKENTIIGRNANKLHAVTRESFIRKELLFKEGDVLNTELLKESERNLRKFDFLTEVKITPVPGSKPETMDVIVHTRDQWSMLIGGTFGGTSESSESGLDFGEKNFLGTGRSLTYNMRHRNGGFVHSYRFKDASLFNSRYLFEAGYKDELDENRHIAKLEKPFYSLVTKTSHGISYERRKHGDEEFDFTVERAEAFYAWSRQGSGDDVLRLWLKLSAGSQNVLHETGSYELTRDSKVVVSTQYLLNPTEYNKEKYIDKFRQVEDIPLGTTLTFSLGPVLKLIKAASTELSAEFGMSRNFHLFQKDYLFTSMAYRMNDDDFNEEYADMELSYYLRRFHHHTFLLHAQLSYLRSDINRFNLGGTEGLRGYEVDEFRGKNLLVVNLEDRIYTYRSMFSGIIEPGFVIFTDLGNTWRDKRDDVLKELHGSFGAGLRLALLKAPGISLIRVDYGHSYDLSRPPIVTVGMEGFF